MSDRRNATLISDPPNHVPVSPATPASAAPASADAKPAPTVRTRTRSGGRGKRRDSRRNPPLLKALFRWDVEPGGSTEAELAVLLPILAGIAFAVATMLVTAALTWSDWENGLTLYDKRFLAAAAAGLVGLGLALRGRECDQACSRNEEPPHSPEEAERRRVKRNETRYNRFLVGLGYALLLCAIANVVALAGLSWNGSLPWLIDGKRPPDARLQEHQVCGIRILVTMNMSVLGALFFIANSLRKKRQCGDEFDAGRFWSGLWYRVGEAILFTVVFYLVLHRFMTPSNPGASEAAKAAPQNVDLWTPILGLLVGMFIQSGERIVYGIAQRVFAGVSAVLPLGSADLSQNAGDQVGGVGTHALAQLRQGLRTNGQAENGRTVTARRPKRRRARK